MKESFGKEKRKKEGSPGILKYLDSFELGAHGHDPKTYAGMTKTEESKN